MPSNFGEAVPHLLHQQPVRPAELVQPHVVVNQRLLGVQGLGLGHNRRWDTQIQHKLGTGTKIATKTSNRKCKSNRAYLKG